MITNDFENKFEFVAYSLCKRRATLKNQCSLSGKTRMFKRKQHWIAA